MSLRTWWHNRRDQRLQAAGYYRASQLDALLRESWGADPLTDSDWNDRAVSYATHVWVYRCCNAVAESLAKVPLRLYQRNRAGIVSEVQSHPAIDLLAYQHDGNLHQDLWELAGIDLGLSGNHLWGLERNASNVPVQIHRLHPRAVKPVKHRKLYVTAYEYKPDPSKPPTIIPAADVVHFQYTSPDDLTWGMAPWLAAAESINTDLDAQKHNRRLLKNWAIPRYALVSDKPIDDPNIRKAIMRAWAEQFRGNNAGKVALLGGMKPERLTLTQEEMDWINLRKLSRVDIRVGYGVPAWVAGDPDESGEGDPQAQLLLFWDSTMSNLCRKRDWQLTREYLSQFPRSEGLWFASDLSEIPCIRQREEESERERNKMYWSGIEVGRWTVNEAKQREGEAPVPWGDRPWLSSTRVQWQPGYTGSAGYGDGPLRKTVAEVARLPALHGTVAEVARLPALRTGAPPASDETAGSLATAATRAETDRERGGEWHTRTMAARDASKGAATRPVTALWRKLFARQAKDAAEYLAKLDGRGLSHERALADDLLQPVTPAERDLIVGALDDTVRAGASNAAAVFGIAEAFDLGADPAVLAWVRDYAGEQIKLIDRSTLATLQEALAQGIADGETMNQLSDRVETAFAEAADFRALRIAQTEVNRAHNEGSHQQYLANDIRQEEWLSALLPTTRDEHAQAHGQIVDIGNDFQLSDGTTMPYPGASGIAAHDINCHCDVAPVA